jgi:sugar diacid utilization regulator
MRKGDAIENEVVLLRCWDTLSLHLSIASRRATTALVEGVVYAVIPVTADRTSGRRVARQTAEGFLARVQPVLRDDVLLGIGGQAPSIAEIPRSRQEADRALLVMRSSGDRAGTIGEIEDMRMQVLLLRLSELAEDEAVAGEGPLQSLTDHDANHGTHFVETLRAYLDAFGDIAEAADHLGIHHNTLRYRLQKLQQVPGLDLKNPEQRLALQLQLRMIDQGLPAR